MTGIENITENEYAHWLFNVPGLGKKSIDKLLCSGKSCSEIFAADKSYFKNIITEKQINKLENSRKNWNFAKEKEKLKENGITFISRIDERFPEKLKNISDPPFAIYVKGSLPDPEKPTVAIIGARMCSDYGRFMARNFGRGLALAGVQVISGMARGVDGISQKAAVSAGGNSFAIVGCGADICYPEENKDLYDDLNTNGGIISEFPPGTMPKANFFPMRNRIISGLADVVLVIEAREKSGTQITVDTALEQGREVMAVPGRVTDRLSDGCNLLISQGAGIAIRTEDVLDRLSMMGKMNSKGAGCKESYTQSKEVVEDLGEISEDKQNVTKALSSIEEMILSQIDIIPVSSSQILEGLYKNGTDISVPELLKTLMDMCYNGLIVQNGAYYRKLAHKELQSDTLFETM
ncbi:DNA-processing protein DprA [Butyrivibrio sp. YAB3001]|uniref:DNA-processing protein DprA n=1 Tax=Butyrivibrio sp. YAB3001 TaxID=1520812 RepID=UPI0008F639FC|nr:DNA-processing protein DprA [Butyrivibrio sp. YAB3001]SFB75113.1 DNA processing protein [Butyrivibrio sp. YAB3001]